MKQGWRDTDLLGLPWETIERFSTRVVQWSELIFNTDHFGFSWRIELFLKKEVPVIVEAPTGRESWWSVDKRY